MVEHDNELGFKIKCKLLNVARSSMYYKPKQSDTSVDKIAKEILAIRNEFPCYGYRRMTVELRKKGLIVNHKKVHRLMNELGIKTIYPKKQTTLRNLQHKVFPYLLRGVKIERPNQVWQVDITYIKIRSGFVYLICLIDVFSRKIMGWKLSTFFDTAACLEAFNAALQHGVPEIINSDQGSQFTSDSWTCALQEKSIAISMDGKGRWADNVYIERLWRTIKYEIIHLHSFDTVQQVRDTLEQYVITYNQQRPHQSLNYHTPGYVFDKKIIPTKRELFDSFSSQQIQTYEVLMVS